MTYDYKDPRVIEDQLDTAKKAVLFVIMKWRADADQYERQVAEATAKGLPCHSMVNTMMTLRQCAKDLERAIKK